MLEVKDLSTGYDGKTILSGVSFTVSSPTIIGLVGPNGSGKSTLLKSIGGIHPFEGEVLFDAHPLSSYRTIERVHRLSYVAQHSGEAIPLTVREVVELGCRAGRGPFSQAHEGDEAVIAEALMHTSLGDIADTRLSELSGGQVQRAMVARAMAQRASVMLLDEPTNHLDLHHQYRLMELLTHICAEHRTIVILAIHDLGLAARYCNKIILLNDGSVERMGAPLEVLTSEVLARVFRVRGRFTTSEHGSPSLTIDGALLPGNADPLTSPLHSAQSN
ncbi:hypothetical protein HMPREF1219_00331 [Corynebacterium pyruviciproducens ATCC BAA-1742]|uniref:ABC transporter domain-containing protein n=1 Tax=Corynebacterium pyruviciproducens ATCC BAA-1742 TaxID=1125779 RepID=S2Z9I9_9CORY|nr:ABC transporter ATP-binding protein [Corynebacterium pyruviciproducens]EPD71035.1 hypothetical protein HMPREF1219_00331 [Corynebacterium pyruviciproducens ATCC BAA-1742]